MLVLRAQNAGGLAASGAMGDTIIGSGPLGAVVDEELLDLDESVLWRSSGGKSGKPEALLVSFWRP